MVAPGPSSHPTIKDVCSSLNLSHYLVLRCNSVALVSSVVFAILFMLVLALACLEMRLGMTISNARLP